MKKMLCWMLGCKPEHLTYQIAAVILIGFALFGFAKLAYTLADRTTRRPSVEEMIESSNLHDGINYIGTTKINGKTFTIYVEED